MIGIVIPAYNEEKNIAGLVEKIQQTFGQTNLEHMICIVDDSPSDATEKIMGESSARYIHRKMRDGRGSAVLDGFRTLLGAECDIIVEMDADFSHNPSELPHLIQKFHADHLDLLIASRYLSESRIENWPRSRRLFSRAANIMAKTLLRVPVSDYTNGYRVYSRAAVEMIVRECGKIGKGFIPLSEILVQTYYRGFRVGEMPTVFVNRLRGESSLNRKEITNAFFGIWKIHALKRRLAEERSGWPYAAMAVFVFWALYGGIVHERLEALERFVRAEGYVKFTKPQVVNKVCASDGGCVYDADFGTTVLTKDPVKVQWVKSGCADMPFHLQKNGSLRVATVKEKDICGTLAKSL